MEVGPSFLRPFSGIRLRKGGGLCEKCKKNIDNAGITKDNVGEISEYAKIMYNRGRYDEVEAEFVTWKRKKV